MHEGSGIISDEAEDTQGDVGVQMSVDEVGHDGQHITG